MRMRVALLASTAAVVVAFLAAAPRAGAEDEPAEPSAEARPQIFKWIDENGIAHYTTDRDRIPASLRRKARRLGQPAPALETDSVAARAPTDSFDAWVTRNRSEAVRDVWDEGDGTGLATGAVAATDPGFDAGTGAPAPRAAPPTEAELAQLDQERDDVDQRIAEIEAEVAAYEELMKLLISDPGIEPLDRDESPDFRAVAKQLPQRLTELRALQERREELETP